MSAPSAFVGNVPERYDRCLGPMLFEKFADDMAARVAGREVLELAAGTGIVTQRLLARLPADGRLVATDLNQPMLDVAASKLSDPRLSFEAMDACALTCPNASFDAIACQFGLMFFPDKPLALAHCARILRHGGQAVFNVWDSLSVNPVTSAANETLTEVFPDDPPLFYQTPFSMFDRPAVEAMFTDAGFSAVQGETLEFPCVSESIDKALEGMLHGNPVAAQIEERGTVPIGEIEARLRDKLLSRFGDHPMRGTMQAHVVTAVKA